MSDSVAPTQEAARSIHILVVEDDQFVRQILEMYLNNEGYQVTLARDGNEMRAVLAAKPAQLVLMDVRLPGEDGFTLTRYLRAHYQLGIIILTTRHDTVDRVVGLECGADDYVTKPFEERELLARIRSVLRRTGTLGTSVAHAPAAATGTRAQRLSFQGCVLDEELSTFRGRDGKDVELTTNECRLLAYLVRNARQVQSREALTAAVLQRQWDPMDRSIDVLITRVRHKIEVDPKRPMIIKTVRGTGYVVTPDVSLSDSAA
jgi:DNA-binding response OmpR family regulator